MNRREIIIGASCLVAESATFACLWDRDTIRDELQTKASTYDLIMGQFPHHGDAYYHIRIREILAKVKAKIATLQDENDLAVALIRVEQFDKAKAILARHHQLAPGSYEVNSNVGILHKKTGNFVEAHRYIAKALQIKPAGHMGLGDWYLKRIAFSRDFEGKGKPVPEKNFLGEAYADFQPHPRPKKKDQAMVRRGEFAMKLIRNDRHFADAYLVSGDLLWDYGDLNLALRAYFRAEELGHPNKKELTRRIDAIINHWKLGSVKEPDRAALRMQQRAKFYAERKQVERWLAEFERAEEAALKSLRSPSFDQTRKRMRMKQYRPTS